MNKIAILPIRSASKRIPGKNFKKFCGIPLYAPVLAELVSSELFDKIVFAVDAVAQIPNQICEDPKVLVYQRSPENSQDMSSSESLMIEVSETLSIDLSDFVFLFQATNPFLRRKYLQSAVDQVQTQKFDSIISTIKSRRFSIEEVCKDGFKRERTQDKKSTALETGVLWATRFDALKENKSRIGLSPGTIEIDENDDFDIDTVSDLEFIAEYLENYIAKNQGINKVLKSWFPLEMALLNRQFETRRAMRETFSTKTIKSIGRVANVIKGALVNDGKVVLFGNGGSAADSQHIAAEFVSRLKNDRVALPALALTTDTSALTAIGNDYGFEFLFERQVQSLVRPQDVVIGITTSGRSVNVLKGLAAAREIGAYTVILTGQDAVITECANETLASASSETAAIQEIHIQLGHIICALSEEAYV
ncbi:SIS domain-containing protein [Amylibacter sp.]|jgi:D-sedoheptulose 7-phosphate isomerase|nr:SIS domain-containing protein [Amylibacter sp.]